MLTAGRLMPSPTPPTSGGAALRVLIMHTCFLSLHSYVSRSPTLCSLAQKIGQVSCHVSSNMYVVAQHGNKTLLSCHARSAEATLNTAAYNSQLVIQQVLERHVPLPGAL